MVVTLNDRIVINTIGWGEDARMEKESDEKDLLMRQLKTSA